MNLLMDGSVGGGYRSGSQIARVVTEAWCEKTLYCALCDAGSLRRTRNNTEAADFVCGKCNCTYELKSSSRWTTDRIADAGYASMVRALTQNRAPNLLVLQYTRSWTVNNLLLVPAFCITEQAIEKRPPLGPNARRAGWIGCNIRLTRIAPEGQIRIVRDGVAADLATIRREFDRIRPVSSLTSRARGWALEVLRCVHRLNRPEFTLDDIYAAEPYLSALYPRNRHIRPKIRQQLPSPSRHRARRISWCGALFARTERTGMTWLAQGCA